MFWLSFSFRLRFYFLAIHAFFLIKVVFIILYFEKSQQQNKNNNRKNNSIIPKQLEIMVGNVLHKPRNSEQGSNKRNNKSKSENRKLSRSNTIPLAKIAKKRIS